MRHFLILGADGIIGVALNAQMPEVVIRTPPRAWCRSM